MRAQTANAKTQVELAQYRYMLPRLQRLWTHLERQGGGSGSGALQFEYFIRPQWSLLLEGEYHIYGSKLNVLEDTKKHRIPWANAGALNLGFRYYFDTRKDKDPYAPVEGLNSNNLPIRKKKEPKQKPLPNKHLTLTVRKSPCGEGTNTFDAYEMRIHTRIVDIKCSPNSVSEITNFKIKPGVDINIKIWSA